MIMKSAHPTFVTRTIVLALALVSLLLPRPASAAAKEKEKDRDKLTWLTDLPAAKTEAARDRKTILLNFTGSDWCPLCRKFKKDVLDKPEFVDFARTNLVLVEVDFPQRKRQSKEQARTNDALLAQFAIGIYPTFVLLSADGTELGRQVGYLQGGPAAFIGKLRRFQAPPP